MTDTDQRFAGFLAVVIENTELRQQLADVQIGASRSPSPPENLPLRSRRHGPALLRLSGDSSADTYAPCRSRVTMPWVIIWP